jgi:hypothetical protein
MSILDRIAYTVICLLIGLILGASWVLSELSPQIDQLVQANLQQDNEIRLLKAKAEMWRVKKK